jgi:hypothetical protein
VQDDRASVDMFAAPRGEAPIDRRRVRRTAVFAVLRVVSLLTSTVVFTVSASLVGQLTEPTQIFFMWAMGLVIWLPTTILQLRIRFFPSPPDPWLGDDDGGHSEQDLRRLGRSEILEMLLGMGPPLVLLAWFARESRLPPSLQVLLLVIPLLFVLRAVSAIRQQLLREAVLALAAGRAEEARASLEPFSGRGRRWIGDYGLYLLCRARFQTGDRAGALAALHAIGDADGYAVDVVEAQIDVERLGPERILEMADRLHREPRSRALAAPLRALAWLHQDRDDLVLADEKALVGVPWAEARRFSALLLAAAMASRDPARARALVGEIGWPLERVRALAACWPPVARRLAPLLTP